MSYDRLSNNSDSVVRYDQLADRWLITPSGEGLLTGAEQALRLVFIT